MTNIQNMLKEFNPWWKNTFHLAYEERDIYPKLHKFMQHPQIIALTGLRRVGKTTLLFKLIQDALEKSMDPKRIMYFSFDEFKTDHIRKIIDAYLEIMDFDIKDGNFLILLDEIQKIDDWENQIKTLYDLYKGKIKFVISGSSSLFIRRKSKESLAGRIFEFKIEQLTFREFIHFKKQKYEPINLYSNELLKLIKEYVKIQGFPELINIKDEEYIKKYLREGVIDRIIFKDLQELENIKDISVIESLINIIISNPGQIIEVHELSQQMGITRKTLSNYLRYLEETYLIKKLYNFSKNARKSERKLKKYYPAILSPHLTFNYDELTMSKIFEWFIVTQLHAEFFWRDPYGHEVDAILQNSKIIPIEVKFGKIETAGLEAFMKKYKLDNGFVISYKEEHVIKKNNMTIKVVPAFRFLLDYTRS